MKTRVGKRKNIAYANSALEDIIDFVEWAQNGINETEPEPPLIKNPYGRGYLYLFDIGDDPDNPKPFDFKDLFPKDIPVNPDTGRFIIDLSEAPPSEKDYYSRRALEYINSVFSDVPQNEPIAFIPKQFYKQVSENPNNQKLMAAFEQNTVGRGLTPADIAAMLFEPKEREEEEVMSQPKKSVLVLYTQDGTPVYVTDGNQQGSGVVSKNQTPKTSTSKSKGKDEWKVTYPKGGDDKTWMQLGHRMPTTGKRRAPVRKIPKRAAVGTVIQAAQIGLDIANMIANQIRAKKQQKQERAIQSIQKTDDLTNIDPSAYDTYVPTTDVGFVQQGINPYLYANNGLVKRVYGKKRIFY